MGLFRLFRPFLDKIERVVKFQNGIFLGFDVQLFRQHQTKVFKLAFKLYFHAIGTGKHFRVGIGN